MTETEDLPLTDYARARDKSLADRNPIAVRIFRQGIFALGVGLFVYGLMFFVLWMSSHPFQEEPVLMMAWGAALISLVLPLPRRWV